MQAESPNLQTEISVTGKYFLGILRDFLQNRKTILPDGIDWTELLHLARIHGTEGIVYHQLQKQIRDLSVPNNVRVKLFKAHADTCFRYEKRSELLAEINDAFQREKIPYLIFKGIEIADLYPIPKLRTMGDTDILMHESDKDRAHDLLLALGCKIEMLWWGGGWEYSRNHIDLELHHKLMYKEPSNFRAQQKFFEKSWEYAKPEIGSVRYHLDWNYHFIYVVTHLRKHLINSGVGFRMFMDVAVMTTRCELDWTWVRKTLKRLRMWDFMEICLAFCKRWFEIDISIETDKLDERFYVTSTVKFLNGGIHGTDEAGNENNCEIFAENKVKTHFRLWLQRWQEKLFPSYAVMCDGTCYDFLKGRPYLLPAAWGWRFIRALGHRKKALENISEKNPFTQEQFNRRTAFLKQWKIRYDL